MGADPRDGEPVVLRPVLQKPSWFAARTLAARGRIVGSALCSTRDPYRSADKKSSFRNLATLARDQGENILHKGFQVGAWKHGYINRGQVIAHHDRDVGSLSCEA